MGIDETATTREELNDALKAIDTLTKRLINLACIEDKLIANIRKVEAQKWDCVRILEEIKYLHEEMREEFKTKEYFFSFRFKWIEKLIMKHSRW